MGNRFEEAKQRYAKIGVDVDRALDTLANKPISIHCWQGDDVGGFENKGHGFPEGYRQPGIIPARRALPKADGRL